MIPKIQVIFQGDNAWPDLADRGVTEVHSLAVARLPGGMQSGATALAIRIDLPDGNAVIALTSLRAWRAATLALEGAEQR